MGPRLFSRGNATRRDVGRRSTVASMGPRLFSRGNKVVPEGGKAKGTGFNGAAAFQPRKRKARARCPSVVEQLQWGRGFSAAETRTVFAFPCRHPTGFNGAAAFQPRKLGAVPIWSCARRASMGPRLFSRGNTLEDALVGFVHNAASMGPRLFSRGNICANNPGLIVARASMGPRLFSRGNASLLSAHRRRDALLQWGRGFSAAETPPQTPKFGRPTTSFNGAAAFQPRKQESQYTQRPRIESLQWGRGFSAAETWCHKMPYGYGEHASMGPRLFSRGNVADAPDHGSMTSCFNGAAAFQPRKLASTLAGIVTPPAGFNGAAAFQPRKPKPAVIGKPPEVPLQWGRGFSAAETAAGEAR